MSRNPAISKMSWKAAKSDVRSSTQLLGENFSELGFRPHEAYYGMIDKVVA